MKILLLVTSLDRGGIETALLRYLQELDRRGLLNRVAKNGLHFDLLINREEIGSLEGEFRALGCEIFRMSPLYPSKFASYRRELTEFLQNHPYDIVHSHLEERSYFAAKVISAHFPAIRLFVQAHNANSFSFLDPKSYFRRYFIRGLRRLGSKLDDKLGRVPTDPSQLQKLAVSKFSARWLWGTVEGVKLLHNPVNFQEFKFSEAKRAGCRRQLGVDEDEVLLICVGRLTEQKNQLFLLEVLAKLNERSGERYKLLLVGKGSDEVKLRKRAAELGVSECVLFLGEVKSAANYLSASDIFLMPSLFEGLGIVALEALANGLPVLTSDRVPNELFEISEGLDIQKLSISPELTATEAWVSKIQQLSLSLNQETRRSQLQLQALQNSEYSAENATEELVEIYAAV